MKRILAIILSALLIMSMIVVGVSAQGNNLLANGDFNTTALGNWWMRGDWNGGSWNYSSSEGIDGTGALVVQGTGAGSADQNAGLFYTAEEGQEAGFVPVAGENYKVSFMVFYADNTASDVYMDINEGALGSGHAAGNPGWNGVEFTFTAPSADPIKVRLVVNSLGDGEKVVIDNVSIISLSGNHAAENVDGGAELDLTTELLGDNLIANGDFNSANTSKWWFRTDWNGGYWMRQANGGVDDTGCIVANGFGSGQPGENAGAFYTDTEGQEAFLQLKPDTTYQLDVDLFRPDGYTGNLYVDVNEGGCGVASCTKNGEWEHVSFRFLGEAAPVKVRVVANALASGSVAYVDNVMIREVGAQPTVVEEESNTTKESLPALQGVVADEKAEIGAEDEKGMSWIVWVVIAVVVIALAAVAYIVIKRKKAAPVETEEEAPAEEAAPEENAGEEE